MATRPLHSVSVDASVACWNVLERFCGGVNCEIDHGLDGGHGTLLWHLSRSPREGVVEIATRIIEAGGNIHYQGGVEGRLSDPLWNALFSEWQYKRSGVFLCDYGADLAHLLLDHQAELQLDVNKKGTSLSQNPLDITCTPLFLAVLALDIHSYQQYPPSSLTLVERLVDAGANADILCNVSCEPSSTASVATAATPLWLLLKYFATKICWTGEVLDSIAKIVLKLLTNSNLSRPLDHFGWAASAPCAGKHSLTYWAARAKSRFHTGSPQRDSAERILDLLLKDGLQLVEGELEQIEKDLWRDISPEVQFLRARHDADPGAILPAFVCPLTLECMNEPYLAADSHTYERKAILKHLQTSWRSPMTNEPLVSKEIQLNRGLQQSMVQYATHLHKEAFETLPRRSKRKQRK